MLKAKKKIKKKELKEDQFVLTVVKIQEYLMAHVKELSTIAIVVLVVIAGSFYIIQDKANRALKADQKLAEAANDMAMGKTNEATEIYKLLSEKYDDTHAAALANMRLAQQAWKENRQEDAKMYFERVIDTADDLTPLVSAAYAGLGDYYFSKNDYSNAVKMYRQAAANAVSKEQAAYYLYSAALSMIDAKDISSAQKTLKTIVKEYEETPSYLPAEKLLNTLGVIG